MRFLVDTCVISELFTSRPHPAVDAWVARQIPEDLFYSVLTLGEIRKGIARLPEGEKKHQLEDRFFEMRQDLDLQILPLDQAELLRWGWMCGLAEKKKRGTLPVMDSLLAATALEHGLVVATRNVKDFERCGVGVVNPWEG